MMWVRERRKGEKKVRIPTFSHVSADAGRLSAATWRRLLRRMGAGKTLASRGCAWPRLSEMGQRLQFILRIFVAQANTRFLLVIIRKSREKENKLALV